MRSTIRISIGLVAVGALVAAAMLGHKVPISEQIPLYSALRNTAAIIFGVMGVWLAIIFPEVLSRAHKEQSDLIREKDRERIRRLLKPIFIATAIVAVTLIATISAPLLREVVWLERHGQILRGASYVLLVSLTLAQIISLLLALAPADALRREHNFKQQRAERDANYKRLQKK